MKSILDEILTHRTFADVVERRKVTGKVHESMGCFEIIFKSGVATTSQFNWMRTVAENEGFDISVRTNGNKLYFTFVPWPEEDAGYFEPQIQWIEVDDER